MGNTKWKLRGKREADKRRSQITIGRFGGILKKFNSLQTSNQTSIWKSLLLTLNRRYCFGYSLNYEIWKRSPWAVTKKIPHWQWDSSWGGSGLKEVGRSTFLLGALWFLFDSVTSSALLHRVPLTFFSPANQNCFCFESLKHATKSQSAAEMGSAKMWMEPACLNLSSTRQRQIKFLSMLFLPWDILPLRPISFPNTMQSEPVLDCCVSITSHWEVLWFFFFLMKYLVIYSLDYSNSTFLG